MKHLSFPVLLACIILPPLLFVITLGAVEQHLQSSYRQEIEGIYLGDVGKLLDGSVDLKQTVSNNIDRYLAERKILAWGVIVRVTVSTLKGTLLYPSAYAEHADSLDPVDPMQTASDNFSLLNEQPRLETVVDVPYNAPFSISILGGYILLFATGLYLYFRRGADIAQKAEQRTRAEIDRLTAQEDQQRNRMAGLVQEKKNLDREIGLLSQELKTEQRRSHETEEEMLDEMVALEAKLEQNLARQQALESQIEEFEKESRQKQKQRQKKADSVKKRFIALYKNLDMHERAVDRFCDLTEELKVKSEEIIHQLDRDPSGVIVKRKVFGKKGHETVFEIRFAYNGRLYFRKTTQNRVEVLSVGTKNNQQADLKFLEKL